MARLAHAQVKKTIRVHIKKELRVQVLELANTLFSCGLMCYFSDGSNFCDFLYPIGYLGNK